MPAPVQLPIVTRTEGLAATVPVFRCHTTSTPAACQMSPASRNTRVTIAGERSDTTVTPTTNGGVVASGRAVSAADARRARARLEAISILPPVDGCDHQKFDVRSREDWTSIAHTVHIRTRVRFESPPRRCAPRDSHQAAQPGRAPDWSRRHRAPRDPET